MKNCILKMLLIASLIMMILAGCGREQYIDEQGKSNDLIGGRFVVVDKYEDKGDEGAYYSTSIVYDKDTKVMYYILDGYRKTGLCPMYDTNGNLMVYGGEIDDK